MKNLLLCLLAISASACHDLTPKQAARLDRFECQARALAKVVEPAIDATVLLTQLYTGEADLASVLLAASASQDEVDALVEDLKACGTIVHEKAAPEPGRVIRASW